MKGATGCFLIFNLYILVPIMGFRGKHRYVPGVFAEAHILILSMIFFVSGMAAIIYQLIWQRALFTIFGTNVESVTVVVAAFMLGLGLGSLMGGWFSIRMRNRLLFTFALFELCIGTFGLVSLGLFHKVGSAISVETALMTGLVAFLSVLFPTVLMGATLPLLVEYAVSRIRSVGRSVGVFYFANTLGSAFACFVCVSFLFRTQGESGSVVVAASLNYLVAALVLVSSYVKKRRDVLAGQEELK